MQEFSEYQNFDECLAYIEESIIKHGPIDGLLGFSQVPRCLFMLISSDWYALIALIVLIRFNVMEYFSNLLSL